jgi:hypothetical protein
MSKKNKKKKAKRARAHVKPLQPVKLAPNSYLVPVVVKTPIAPEVTTWRAFVNWLESFTS